MSSPGFPGEYETEAKAVQVKKENLTRERYGGLRASVYYDLIVDNENHKLWFWLPTPSKIKVLGIKKVDMTDRFSNEPQYKVSDFSEILRREDMIVEGYEEVMCFKGEEPEAFWSLFERAANMPHIEEDKSIFRGHFKNYG